MTHHPRYSCAHTFHRAHRARRPWLESLEPRLALSASTVGDPGIGPNITIEPTVLEQSVSSAIVSSSHGTNTTVVASPLTYGQSTPWGLGTAQVRGAYDVADIAFGSISGDGAGQTIAIVDAYDDPSFVDSTSPAFLGSDLAVFDQQYGLPNPPSFSKFNESGDPNALPGVDPVAPGTSGDWEEEEALDVEWAHAMAPGAAIDLVEATTDNGSDLYQAVATAAGLPGVSVVSSSWGSPEFSGEQAFDPDFTTPSGHQGVTFVASAGDTGSPGLYPAYSPNVLAVGGTSLTLQADGSYSTEIAWSGSGGGTSTIETEPSFQTAVQQTGMRTIPDVSFDADPLDGVSVYDSYNDTAGNQPWIEVGGTSLAAPCWAGLIAIANQGRTIEGAPTLDGPSQTMAAINALPQADFHDVTQGNNGGFSAGPGYDEVTGLGSPVADLVVPGLASYNVAAGLSFVTSVSPQITAGTPLDIEVEVENSAGQLETNYIGTVTLELTGGPAGSTINGATTVVVENGIANFSGLTVTETGAGYTFSAHTEGPGTATSSSFTVSPAAPSQLVMISPIGQLTVGERLTVTVLVEDVYGNLISDYTGTASLSFVRKASKPAPHGSPSSAIVDGVAAFGGIRVTQKDLGEELRISCDGLTSALSSPVRVAPVVHLTRAQARGTHARHNTAKPSFATPAVSLHTAHKTATPHKTHAAARHHIVSL
jgi:subtilase family serine protease